MPEFAYQDPFPPAEDNTKYRVLTKDYVSVASFENREILKVDPEGLRFLAREAMRDVSFLLRTPHLEQVAAILDDPDASPNDRGVALAMLKNAEVASSFVLPLCQDTGMQLWFVKAGHDFPYLSQVVKAIPEAIARATAEVPLRPNTVDPFTGTNPKNNLGHNMPGITIEMVDGDGAGGIGVGPIPTGVGHVETRAWNIVKLDQGEVGEGITGPEDRPGLELFQGPATLVPAVGTLEIPVHHEGGGIAHGDPAVIGGQKVRGHI